MPAVAELREARFGRFDNASALERYRAARERIALVAGARRRWPRCRSSLRSLGGEDLRARPQPAVAQTPPPRARVRAGSATGR